MRRVLRRARHRLWLIARGLERRTSASGEMTHAEDRARCPEWGPLG